MQPLEIVARRVLAHRCDKHRSVGTKLAVNDRRRGDTDDRSHLTAATIIGWHFICAKHRDVPEQTCAIGIEGINAVIFRAHEQNIMCAVGGNRNTCSVERLRVHFAVHVQDP